MAFLYRLLPPRPSFADDMDPGEADAMERHVATWQDLLNRDVALAFGPVLDPEDPWVWVCSISMTRRPLARSATTTPPLPLGPALTRSCQCNSSSAADGPIQRSGEVTQIRNSRPSPAIIVAVVALVAAVGGTALGGQIATPSKIGEKKVKKIANKQINKRLPLGAEVTSPTARWGRRSSRARFRSSVRHAPPISRSRSNRTTPPRSPSTRRSTTRRRCTTT